MKRVFVLTLTVAILTSGIVAATYKVLNGRTAEAPMPAMAIFQDKALGIQIKYPNSLRHVALSEQDTKDKVLLRLIEPLGTPPLLVTLRYEQGLRPLSVVVKKETLEILLSNIERSYPQRFPGYQKLSER